MARGVRRRRPLQPFVLEPVSGEPGQSEYHRREHELASPSVRTGPAKSTSQREGRERDRADGEAQQDETHRCRVVERVLHDHERRAVSNRRGDQRELRKQRVSRVP